MAAKRRTARAGTATARRFTVDASVFVNAFNPHEEGHAASLQILSAIQERGDPVIVPTLLISEIAAAVARATGDRVGALQYAMATAALPHLTLVSLTAAVARQAADLAATYRLRAADAVYVTVARRYGTTIVSRDDEQRTRGAAVIRCLTPEQALTL
ncbi:MAG TPA: type II toxin-antitoxin system VapC family toxin [Vicinamibacterales bacterium]|jgi:predicted nucleic acid-binding protein